MPNPEPLIPLDEDERRARRLRRFYFPLGVPTPVPPIGTGVAFCVGETAYCVVTTAFTD